MGETKIQLAATEDKISENLFCKSSLLIWFEDSNVQKSNSVG